MIQRYFFVAAVLMLSGCSYINPYIQDFNIVSVEQEAQIGNEMRQAISGQMTLVTDARQVGAVSQLGERLVKALPRKDYDFRFFVVEEPSPNAFAIPGGSIYVHTGLMKFATQGELAGVLAHEIGHVYERHPAKAVSRTYGMQYLTGLLFEKNTSKWQAVTAKMLESGLLNKYGRDDEREADEIGFYLLKRAGYKGDELISFLRKLESITEGGSTPAFLSTHPPTPERIARLESLANPKADIQQYPLKARN